MGSKNKDDKKKKKVGGDEVGKWKKKPIEDERFAKANYDPRFQNVPKHKSKVIIDQRFSRVFTDKSFNNSSSSSGIDKRGKVKTHSESDVSRYYHFDDHHPETNDKNKNKEKVLVKGKVDDDDDDESSGSGSEELPDPELELELSATEDDTDDEVSGDDASLEVEEVPLIEKETHRLAVVNMDWTQVKAVDLFVMLSSCLPKEGQIKSVTVYPSEFGLKRMEEEAVRGPVALFENDQKIDDGGSDEDSDDDDDDEFSDTEKDADDVSDYEDADDVNDGEDVDEDEGFVGSDSEEGDEDSVEEGGENDDEEDDDEDEDEEDDDIDSEKLRAYEKSRLRYYYGVVECDSVATADYLYKACDGIEFERSSNVLDLRFIPDSMKFKHEPRDVATEAPAEYEGLDFHTRALQQSNTVLSWDDDEPHRVKTLRRNFTEKQLAEMEVNEFLASDESESDEDEDENGNQDLPEKKKKKADMYRALLQSGDGSEEEDEGQNMEVTFATGLEDISKKIIEKKEKGSETVFEAYLRKKKEKKDAQKNHSKTSSDNDSDDESDDDRTSKEDPDDFFEEPPSHEKSKKGGRGKKKKAEKVELEKEEAEAASKAELELLFADDNGADKKLKGYNIKHKKAKGKNAKDIPDKTNLPNVEIDDPRFAALFNNPVFALDPTDPQFKRSATYYRQLAQKNQQKSSREHGEDAEPVEPSIPEKDHLNGTSQKDKHELSAMIKSLKMKAQQLSAPSAVKRKDMESNGQTTGKKKHKLPGSDRSSKKARHRT